MSCSFRISEMRNLAKSGVFFGALGVAEVSKRLQSEFRSLLDAEVSDYRPDFPGKTDFAEYHRICRALVR